MSEAATAVNKAPARQRKLPYPGRPAQALIYIGKFLRMFVYQADWKGLPMAALIAGVVSMVVHRDFFVTMEGTLKGALALTCLSIWNGCFNSIQVVCREREIIKREHRAGMHITAYIFAHMVYQALLCLAQTVITLYVCKTTGIKFPQEGLITPWLIVDIGITIFLMTYAADMLSLWISCMTRSTTTAMTIMPFVLIFQLVFSGGIFALPNWAEKLAPLSISNYGMKCIAAQSDYNSRELVTGWNSLVKLENQEVNAVVTLGQVLDFLQDEGNELVRDLRGKQIEIPGPEEVLGMLSQEPDAAAALGLPPEVSDLAGRVLQALEEQQDPAAPPVPAEPQTVTVGELVDMAAENPVIQKQRDKQYEIHTTVGKLIDMVGREKLENYVQEQTRISNYNENYKNDKGTIEKYWLHIGKFVVLFAVLAVIFLEFVDKDKR